jgi:P pilus assembly chaperone PapD
MTLSLSTINLMQMRVENLALSSGWSGFSALNLESMAERESINVIDTRNIILDKDTAKSITLNYLRNNFKLDNSGNALSGSIFNTDEHPVLLTVDVFNKDDVNNPTSFTTIVITMKIPIEIGPWNILSAYEDKIIYANYSTFLTNSQFIE